MKHLAFFAFIILVLTSCFKKEQPPVIIYGQMTEYGTGQPIENGTVYLYCHESVPFGASSSQFLDSITTDSRGMFYKEYDSEQVCGNMVIQPYKKGYLNHYPLFHTTDNKALDIVMDAEGWLKVVTINDKGGHGVEVGGSFSTAFRLGKYYNSEDHTFYTSGGRTHSITTVFLSGNMINTDSIYVPPHDTVTYEVHY